MAKEQLIVELIAETKDAVKNLKQYTKEAKTSAQKVGALTKIVKSYFAEIMAGIIVAKKIIRVVGDLTKAYMAQEDAVASMEAALRATGSYTPTLSQNLQDLAADLQDVTKYGDESTLEMAGLMQSLANLNGEGLLKTIPLVQDFATGMKIDLQTAASLIGKTLGSTTNALSRYGIILDMTGTQQEKLAELADVVNSKFGGMAEAMGKTYAGQTTILKNAFGDLKEEMGRTIARGITPMLPLALQMVENLKLWIAETNNLKEAKIRLRQAQEGEIELTKFQILQDTQIIDLSRLKLLIAQQDFATRQAGEKGLQKFLELSGQELSDLKEMIKARATEIKVLEDIVKLRDEATDAIKDTIQPLGNLNDLVIVWRDQMAMAGLDAGLFTAALREQKGAIEEQAEVFNEIVNTFGIYNEAAYDMRDANAEVVEEMENAWEGYFDEQVEAINNFVGMWNMAFGAISAASNEFMVNRGIELENDYERRKQYILNNITDETAQKEALAELDKEFDTKRKNLEREQAKRDKRQAIFAALINTAVAISKALTLIWPLNLIMAAIVGVAGAVQVAAIASRPLPFQQGGPVQRRQMGGFGDRVPAMLEPQEVVIDKFTAQKNAAQIGAMRSGESSPQTFNLVLDGRVLAKWIYRASTNKIVTINQKAIVS